VDSATQSRVSDYYKYLSESLDCSPDSEGFALLNDSLRTELICRTAWKALRRVCYLDNACFDKVTHCGLFFFDQQFYYNTHFCCI
jgi:hypothetical protein